MMEIYKQNSLLELSSALYEPLNNKHRIKFTCYDASKRFIVCGANSGSIYLFHRVPCKFLQLIPSLKGTISHVTISPMEQYIAIATQKGTVQIYTIDLKSIQPVVFESHHNDMNITKIIWRQNENQLFLGDTKGRVFLVNINTSMGRNSFSISIHPILFLESPIVQLCEHRQLLLVSTYSKCVLCNIETEEFKQIGNQPRHGKFGACFHKDSMGSNLLKTRIFCARPGARIWECDIDGNVSKTHKFRMDAPTELCPQHDENVNISASLIQHVTTNELQLEAMDQVQTIIGFTSNELFIFEMDHSKIVLRDNRFGPIKAVKVIGDSILIFSSERAFTFQFQPLEEFFYKIISNEEYMVGAQTLVKNAEYFKEKFCDSKIVHYYSLFQNKLSTDEALVKDLFESFNQKFSLNSQDSFDSLCSDTDSLGFDIQQLKVDPDESKFEALSEDEKNLQDLFLIYNSSKLSKFNLTDRYAHIFNLQDSDGIKRLLTALENMIQNCENVSQYEAKQICSTFYLNFLEFGSKKEPDDFVIQSFVIVNSPVSKKRIQRCKQCNFPLNIPDMKLKYYDIAETIVEKLMKTEQIDKLFDIISFVPALLNTLLRFHINAQMINEKTIHMILACSDSTELKSACSNPKLQFLRSYDFWKTVLLQFVQIHNKNLIHCVRCQSVNEFCITKKIKAFSECIYDCIANLFNGATALKLCNEVATEIPSEMFVKLLEMIISYNEMIYCCSLMEINKKHSNKLTIVFV